MGYPERFRYFAGTIKKGKLKGKLKEVAATLEEDDNRVVMLVKSKKVKKISQCRKTILFK